MRSDVRVELERAYDVFLTAVARGVHDELLAVQMLKDEHLQLPRQIAGEHRQDGALGKDGVRLYHYTAGQVADMAKLLELDCVYFLKGKED